MPFEEKPILLRSRLSLCLCSFAYLFPFIVRNRVKFTSNCKVLIFLTSVSTSLRLCHSPVHMANLLIGLARKISQIFSCCQALLLRIRISCEPFVNATLLVGPVYFLLAGKPNRRKAQQLKAFSHTDVENYLSGNEEGFELKPPHPFHTPPLRCAYTVEFQNFSETASQHLCVEVTSVAFGSDLSILRGKFIIPSTCSNVSRIFKKLAQHCWYFVLNTGEVSCWCKQFIGRKHTDPAMRPKFLKPSKVYFFALLEFGILQQFECF